MTKIEFLPAFQMFLEGLAVILGLYLAFFKSYFTERGKIVATKKDIEEITLKIETVKSDVSQITQKKISLTAEKSKTLLEYYTNYSAWLNYIMYASVSANSKGNNGYYEKIANTADDLFHTYLIAEAKLDIYFVDDSELIKLKWDCKLKTIQIHNVFSQAVVNGNFQSASMNVVYELEDGEYKTKRLKEQSEILLKSFEDYHKQKAEHFQELAPLNSKLVSLLNNRIASL